MAILDLATGCIIAERLIEFRGIRQFIDLEPGREFDLYHFTVSLALQNNRVFATGSRQGWERTARDDRRLEDHQLVAHQLRVVLGFEFDVERELSGLNIVGWLNLGDLSAGSGLSNPAFHLFHILRRRGMFEDSALIDCGLTRR